MRIRNLLVLAGIAVLLLILAWVVQRREPEARSETGRSGEAFLAGFLDRVNDVQRIELRKGGESLTLVRGEEGWTAPQHAGYPVKAEQVRQLLIQAARLETVEAKTANPELLGHLELGDPDAPEARSARVDFYASEEKPLASLVVGKMNWGRQKTVYVRHPDEDQAWLCAGELRVDPGTSVWMDRQVARFEADKVQWVEIRHPGGEILRVHRAAQGETFEVDGVPEGRELQTPRAGDSIAGVLSWLSFDEVRKAEDFEPGEAEPVVTILHAFDGLEIRVESWDLEGKVWARFDATAPEAAPAPDEGNADEGKPDEKAAAETGEEEKSPAAVAEELDGKWHPWVFSLPSYKSDLLRRHLEDLLKEVEEPAGEGETAGPPAPGSEGGDQEDGSGS